MSEQVAQTRSAADIERQIALLVGTWIGMQMSGDPHRAGDMKATMSQIHALIWANSPGLSWSAAGQAATDMIEECAEEAE